MDSPFPTDWGRSIRTGERRRQAVSAQIHAIELKGVEKTMLLCPAHGPRIIAASPQEGDTFDDLMQSIAAQLAGAPMAQLSSQLGTDSRSTQNAVQAALPLLLGALASLLDKDDDGTIVDDLGGMLGSFLSGR
jgi:hypothetical protein